MFPLKGGISTTQSPAELILNSRLNFNSHCKVEFGEYVQTHEEHDNSMQSRTIGALATRPSNDAGSYYFYSLSTGCIINRRNWTAVIMYEFYLCTNLEIGTEVELVHYHKRTSRWILNDDRVALEQNVI